jgi:hypothetical protein
MKVLGLNPNINSKTNYANKARVNFSAIPVTPAAMKKLDIFEGRITAEIIEAIKQEAIKSVNHYSYKPLSGLSEKFLAKVIRTAQMIEFSTPEKQKIGGILDSYSHPLAVRVHTGTVLGDDYSLLFDLANESLDFAIYQGKGYPSDNILASMKKRLSNLRGDEEGLQRIKLLKETYDIV